MDRSNLVAIKDGLKREMTSLTVAADKLRASLDEVEQDRGRVKAAIAALDGADGKAPGKRKPVKDKAKASLPAAGKAEVIKYIQTLLQEGGVLAESELKSRVEELAQQHGFTRLGISLRIKEALSDAMFVTTTTGVKLATRD